MLIDYIFVVNFVLFLLFVLLSFFKKEKKRKEPNKNVSQGKKVGFVAKRMDARIGHFFPNNNKL